MKYTFPHEILKPINDAYSGVLSNLKNRFKLNRNNIGTNDARNVIQAEIPQKTPEIINPEIRSV